MFNSLIIIVPVLFFNGRVTFHDIRTIRRSRDIWNHFRLNCLHLPGAWDCRQIIDQFGPNAQRKLLRKFSERDVERVLRASCSEVSSDDDDSEDEEDEENSLDDFIIDGAEDEDAEDSQRGDGENDDSEDDSYDGEDDTDEDSKLTCTGPSEMDEDEDNSDSGNDAEEESSDDDE